MRRLAHITLLLTLGLAAAAAEGPMRFIENTGQWPDEAHFRSRLSFGFLDVTGDGFRFVLHDSFEGHHGQEAGHDHHHGHLDPTERMTVAGHHLHLRFEGGDAQLVTGSQADPGVHHYLLGDDPAHWGTNARRFAVVDALDLYPGIDLRVEGAGEAMKYTFFVQPGTDPSAIRQVYEGVEVRRDGADLTYATDVAEIRETAPVAWQMINGQRVDVPCRFHLDRRSNTVTYAFPDGYDATRTLVIDPTVIFSSYTGSTQDNFGYTATFDDAEHLYGGGIVLDPSPGQSYPTVGPFDATYNGGVNPGGFQFGFSADMAISKFAPDGSSLIFSTYIGGAHNDQPQSLFVDPAGQLVIYGRSYSTDYPTTPLAYQPTKANPGGDNADIVLTRLTPAGNALVGSTYLGGSDNDGVNIDPAPGATTNRSLKFNYADDGRGEVILDATGDIYIASFTRSADLFPGGGSFQASLRGNQDAVVARFSADLSTLVWGSYLGASLNDAAYGIKLDGAGDVFVTGGTNEVGFPNAVGGLNPTFQGGRADGFVAKIAAAGNAVIRSTYLGTPNYDQSFFIEIDEADDVYVYGQSEGGGYPVSPGVYSNAGGSQFIHKLSNDLTTTEWSTVFGSGTSAINISPTAFLVDECQRIYISGWGGNTNQSFNSTTGTTSGLVTQRDAPSDYLDPTTDGSDFYFMVLEKDATDLLYATYFGGTQLGGASGEHVDGGTSRFDFRGTIYQAVCAGCGGNSTFPAIDGGAGLVSATNNSTNCNLGVLKMEIGLPFTQVSLAAAPRLTGCVPLTVFFAGGFLNVTDYLWDFGDGTTSTLPDPVHTYTDTGVYTVTLIGVDSNTCNTADTAFLTITVRDDSLRSAFVDSLVVDCEQRRVTAALPPVEPTTSATWTTGDGSTYTDQDLDHVYAAPGTYTITLFLEDSTSCELADTTTSTITIPPFIDGTASTPDTVGCIPWTVDFTSTITGSVPDAILWDFGDGTTSSLADPSHTYTDSGTYAVQLVVIDSASCNVADTSTVEIVVLDGFVDALLDADAQFFNCDSVRVDAWSGYAGADQWLWDLGDGTTATDSAVTVTYRDTGSYLIELIVVDSSAVCKPRDTAVLDVTLNDLFADITASDTVGCIPFSVTFDVESNAIPDSVAWSFGDGTTGTGTPITHVFADTGRFWVRMTATEALACTAVDVDSFRVTARDDRVVADFTATVVEDCDTTLRIVLDNTSQHVMRVEWSFDDSTATTFEPGEVVFRELGPHTITLVAFNDTACHPVDTMVQTFELLPNAVARFTVDSACTDTELNLVNTSNPAAAMNWSFGDGRTSTLYEPTLSYPTPGTYTITLTVTDTTTCDVVAVDSAVTRIEPTPQAFFVVDTSYYYFEDPVTFQNLSEDETSILWDFGDGTTLADVERPTHVYAGVDSFTACLEASAPGRGCVDTFCRGLFIDFEALLGVPNAFSPNGDGVNDVLFVEGQGITDLDLQIYNRWGQMIFRSRDQAVGWDGTYKGVAQEMEVYVFTVRATFVDGSTQELSGNVTLLR